MSIKTGDYHHLNEVITGLISDVYPSAYGRHINGNEFVSGLTNEHLVENPYEIPPVDKLMENLHNTYRLNKGLLQKLLRASYDDEWQGQRTRPRHVQQMNVNKVKFICQLLLENFCRL